VDQPVFLYGPVAIAFLLSVRRALRIRSVAQYSPSDLESLQSTGRDVLLLDVRSAAEQRTGSIRGSMHIPVQSLRCRMAELEKFKSSDIVCYCQSGNRSVSAALFLKKHGYRAGSLRGGLTEWNFSRHQPKPARAE
jgi:rhodanese-related sulfurtransferase